MVVAEGDNALPTVDHTLDDDTVGLPRLQPAKPQRTRALEAGMDAFIAQCRPPHRLPVGVKEGGKLLDPRLPLRVVAEEARQILRRVAGPLQESFNHLHVLLRHRLPSFPGEPFGGCAPLVEVGVPRVAHALTLDQQAYERPSSFNVRVAALDATVFPHDPPNHAVT